MGSSLGASVDDSAIRKTLESELQNPKLSIDGQIQKNQSLIGLELKILDKYFAQYRRDRLVDQGISQGAKVELPEGYESISSKRADIEALITQINAQVQRTRSLLDNANATELSNLRRTEIKRFLDETEKSAVFASRSKT